MWEDAYASIVALADEDHDAIAALIPETLDDEERGAEPYARSRDAVAKPAAEALAEYEAGETPAVDPEAL